MKNHPLGTSLLISSLPFAVACTSARQPAVVGAEADWDQADAMVWIAGNENDCRYAVAGDGPWVSNLPDLGELDESRVIHVRAEEAVAWKCIAGAIYSLQQGGAKVGFIANPND